MVQRTKPIQVNLRMSAELKEAAEAAAAADHRSLTSLVVKLLTDHCRATGHLPPETPPSGRKGKTR
jgi:predicted HicB family RNase H-like nuclease